MATEHDLSTVEKRAMKSLRSEGAPAAAQPSAASDAEQRLREAMMQIASLAGAAAQFAAAGEGERGHAAHDHGQESGDKLVCTPKTLPKRLLVEAARTARRINPVNAPFYGPLATVSIAAPEHPLFIAAFTSKYWGPAPRKLTVSFMESTAADLRARILAHMNAWTKTACVSFVETQGTGEVRISREAGGYWSYLGTDILHIPKNRPTMNLEGFTMNTAESEYRRVVRHETGHTLGFPHEHMRRDLVARIDPERAYDYFLRTQGWDRQTVDEQVLAPLDERSLMSTPADQTSIMCYQLPGEITRDGRPILGGVDIDRTDYAFAGRIYPKPKHVIMLERDEEWPQEEDVKVELA